jgi:CHAD domain-containing protein
VRIAERFRHKERFLRRTADLLEAIQSEDKPRSSVASTLFRDWAVHQLAATAEPFLDSVPDANADLAALHQFRIRAKALRYSIELLATAFNSDLRDRHYRTIEDLQEQLGRVNDHATARERLRDWAAETNDCQLQDLLCAVAEEEMMRLTTELGAWREWWTADRADELRHELVVRTQGRAVG